MYASLLYVHNNAFHRHLRTKLVHRRSLKSSSNHSYISYPHQVRFLQELLYSGKFCYRGENFPGVIGCRGGAGAILLWTKGERTAGAATREPATRRGLWGGRRHGRRGRGGARNGTGCMRGLGRETKRQSDSRLGDRGQVVREEGDGGQG
jgi:hypothetical protein